MLRKCSKNLLFIECNFYIECLYVIYTFIYGLSPAYVKVAYPPESRLGIFVLIGGFDDTSCPQAHFIIGFLGRWHLNSQGQRA